MFNVTVAVPAFSLTVNIVGLNFTVGDGTTPKTSFQLFVTRISSISILPVPAEALPASRIHTDFTFNKALVPTAFTTNAEGSVLEIIGLTKRLAVLVAKVYLTTTK